MFGFETTQFFRFLVQFFAVVAGASSLWGAVFAYKAKKTKDNINKESLFKISRYALYVFFICSTLFLVGWWILSIFVFPIKVFAHEGVVHSLDFPFKYIQNGLRANIFWVSLLGIINFFALIFYKTRKNISDFFKKYALYFFAIQFLLLSIIISRSAFTKELNKEQIILSLHNWHSILTLGTIVLVDLFFLFTYNKQELKKVLYSIFPLMSVAIWFGLGLDFLTSLLTVGLGFPETTQFIFNQIVVIILVFNGTLLSVRINNKLIESIKSRVSTLSKGWKKIISISGSISITSWLTITFLDFFDFTFSMGQFLFLYTAAILSAYFFKVFLEKYFLKHV